MQVEEFQAALRRAADSQPSVSPAALGRVVRRARRRLAVEGIAVLAAVGLVVGLAVDAAQGGGKGTRLATRPGPQVSVAPGKGPDTTAAPATTSSTEGASTTLPVVAAVPTGPVPAGFTARSVTFVSADTGWALGGVNCAGDAVCRAVLVRTTDGGKTWQQVPAPPTSLGLGSGISGIRFADQNDGWAFGYELWSTHDGGAHWTRSSLAGVAASAWISDLEAGAGIVHAAVMDQTTTNPPVFRIESSPVSHEAWQASPTTLQVGAGPVPGVQIVLSGQSGWMIENDRVFMGGARLVSGRWVPWTPPFGSVGGPAQLDASSPTDVVAICQEGIWGGPPRGDHVYFSTDGGSTFRRVSTAIPESGGTDGIGTPGPGAVLTDTTTTPTNLPQILATFDGGHSWQVVFQGTQAEAMIGVVGFTTPSQGVALDGQGRLLMTRDGGHRWTIVPF